VETVRLALADSGANPALIELEITENVLVKDTEQVLATVRQLHAMGLRLAIDDFGTGYSSLAYLRRFAVEKLKIDQSFVRDLPTDPDAGAIVRAVIQMAKSLKIAVLAEGVETADIAHDLRLLGCDYAQGYYFGRPMPAAAFADQLPPPR
jgi:EAL domain-containing protein (putative c-di-GMP-specific phosphodiesterase class I)